MRAALWHGSHLRVGFLRLFAPWSECKRDPNATHNPPPMSGVVYRPTAMPGQRSYIRAIDPPYRKATIPSRKGPMVPNVPLTPKRILHRML